MTRRSGQRHHRQCSLPRLTSSQQTIDYSEASINCASIGYGGTEHDELLVFLIIKMIVRSLKFKSELHKKLNSLVIKVNSGRSEKL
ncbi:unnamed protein product [Haemonchus placei]|uniref:Uncharacterized protein n=1 Tax=Haemonchus placei TaxID=6290 RepID=A0A3P7TKN3_HAEPC|nr:unnamed protein product [Haemonchus placei]